MLVFGLWNTSLASRIQPPPPVFSTLNLVDYAIEYRVHATRRMFQRHIGTEEVTFVLTHGQVVERYDEDFPLPSVLLNGRTAANRPLHVVVGINVDEQKLVIITTYEPDALQWTDNFSRRIV